MIKTKRKNRKNHKKNFFAIKFFSNQNLVQYPSDPSEAETALEAHKSLVAEVSDMKPRVGSYFNTLANSNSRPDRLSNQANQGANLKNQFEPSIFIILQSPEIFRRFQNFFQILATSERI